MLRFNVVYVNKMGQSCTEREVCIKWWNWSYGLEMPYGIIDLVNIRSGSGLQPDGDTPWPEPNQLYCKLYPSTIFFGI